MQDIHPTIMKVAGIALPTDRVFDGLDLSPVLFAKDRTAASALSRADKGGGHACFFYYRAATWTNATEEIYAVRCGDHKVYWRTWGVAPPEGSTCRPAGTGGIASGRAYICDPPLMFDLDTDPGENTPLRAASPDYKTTLAAITDAKAKHIATLTPVEDQNGRGSDPQFALCEDPDSQGKPATKMWPRCTSNPENWQPEEICSSKACLDANPSFAACCEKEGVCTPLPHLDRDRGGLDPYDQQ
jgi:arylsulfatase A